MNNGKGTKGQTMIYKTQIIYNESIGSGQIKGG
jgi:hypothetical protein